MFHRNLLGVPDPPSRFLAMVTESGTTCADPRSGSWFGRVAEQSPLAVVGGSEDSAHGGDMSGCQQRTTPHRGLKTVHRRSRRHSTCSMRRTSTGGVRPRDLVEPQPLERGHRRTVEQNADFAPVVQILHVPVPPIVTGGVQDRILQCISTQVSVMDTEQVIDVPMLSSQVPSLERAVLPAPQMAEQLMEVPSVSPSSCVVSHCSSSSLSSRPLTFHFLVVWGVVEQIFKVSSQDRVQQLVVG